MNFDVGGTRKEEGWDKSKEGQREDKIKSD